MAGPSLALFMPQAEEEADAPRARKLPMEDNEGKPSDEEQPAKDKPKPLLPISHEVVLESHEKSIQALTIDREGTRMITGGLDYRMKVWDFTTMNRNLKPYKDFKPFDGHPIRALSFNPSSSHFLCCCGNNQAKVYNSDCVRKKTTIRGDMYLQDMANTKGHVASINDGKWHPKNDQLFITGS